MDGRFDISFGDGIKKNASIDNNSSSNGLDCFVGTVFSFDLETCDILFQQGVNTSLSTWHAYAKLGKRVPMSRISIGNSFEQPTHWTAADDVASLSDNPICPRMLSFQEILGVRV